MIEVKYFAADLDIDKDPSELYISLKNQADNGDFGEPISENTLKELENNIKSNLVVSNYANFFGNGLDLMDSNIEFGGYTGYIPPYNSRNDQDNYIYISWSGTEVPELKNGISIIFNKYVCKGIKVWSHSEQGANTLVGEIYNENGLPLNTYVPFEIEQGQDHIIGIWVLLYNFIDNTPYNIQGIILGKTIDIEDIKSFDMLTEVNPISDDLSINETNITAIVDEDFNSNYGQKVLIYDNGKMILDNVIKDVSEDDTSENQYEIKTRSKIDVLDKTTSIYPYVENDTLDNYFDNGIYNDWYWKKVYFGDVVNYLNSVSNNAIRIIYPEDASIDDMFDIDSKQISTILKPSTIRQIIQQLGWAMGYMVDSTFSNTVDLIDFSKITQTEPDIIINNDDDRILKTSVKNGTVYSKILWYTTKYEKKYGTNENLGKSTLEYRGVENGYYIYGAKLVLDEPCTVTNVLDVKDGTRIATNDMYVEYSPFEFEIIEKTDRTHTEFEVSFEGKRYSKVERVETIYTGNTKGETLEIKNQTLYPIFTQDIERKSEQLRKWYTNNNTLTATVVDNDSEIQVGKIVKIQLKKGNYFQGVVTSVVRTNINDYHTVELEAHEWN